jgi:succinoglycan biosynthesis transport protein ExoP
MPTTPNKLGAQFSPLSIVRAIWKHWLLLAVVTVTLSAGTIAYVYRMPPIYRAEALILVDSQKIPEKYVASTVNNDVGDRLQTISQQILSGTRLKKIIDDFDMYHEERKTHGPEEIAEMMRKDIDIKLERGWTGGRPGAFRVAYKGSQPTIVASVANRIANLFIDENLRTREVQAEGTSQFIETQLQDAQKKLDETEAAVSRWKVQHNGELPEQENSLVGALSRLQVELQGNQDAINRSQQTKIMLESSLNMTEATEAQVKKVLDLNAANAANPAYVSVGGAPAKRVVPEKTSEAMLKQLELLRTRYGDAHPEVLRLKSDIAGVQKLEADQEKKDKSAQGKQESDGLTSQSAETASSKITGPEIKSAGPEPGDKTKTGTAKQAALTPPELLRVRQQITVTQTQLDLTNKEIATLTAERQQIIRNIDTYERRIAVLPVRDQEMTRMLRDYEVSKENYRSLLQRKNSADMSTDMERRQVAERFTVLDPATVPDKPFSPNRPLWNGVGCIAGLAIGLALAIGKELQKDVLLGEWELPSTYTILGRVPQINMLETDDDPAHTPAGLPDRRKKRWRFALLSSAVLAVLAIAAVGIYVAFHRL